jgi:hypothetical protein
MRNHEQVPENRHCTSNAPALAFAHEISSMLYRVIEQLRRRREKALVNPTVGPPWSPTGATDQPIANGAPYRRLLFPC